MGISINIQGITRARARKMPGHSFSTVQIITQNVKEPWDADSDVDIFLTGPGHEDCAARIAALINEQVIRRDKQPEPTQEELLAEAQGDEAAYEQERQEEEQAESARRELEADEYARAFPKLRDREERADDKVPF
jgi:hypothetical protein